MAAQFATALLWTPVAAPRPAAAGRSLATRALFTSGWLAGTAYNLDP